VRCCNHGAFPKMRNPSRLGLVKVLFGDKASLPLHWPFDNLDHGPVVIG
jgi:hypothetical protein